MTKMVRQTLRKAGWAVMALLAQLVHCQPAGQEVSQHYRRKSAGTDRMQSGYTPVGYRVQIEGRCLVLASQETSVRLDLGCQKSRGCT